MEVAINHWHAGNVFRRSAPTVNKTGGILAQGPDGLVPTIPQLTLFVMWIVAICLWVFRMVNSRSRTLSSYVVVETEDEDVERGEPSSESESKHLEQHSTTSAVHRKDSSKATKSDEENENSPKVESEEHSVEQLPNGSVANDGFKIGQKDRDPEGLVKKEAPATANSSKSTEFSKTKPSPTLDNFLKCCALLGLIMMYYYVCDYYHKWPRAERVYSRDTYAFLCIVLVAVAALFTIKTTPDKLINRDQTEEWKGWMQVGFVWYHYFAAKETYNYIRLFIACYVWMTGFGNFSFFWVRKDFSLWRMLKMLFRLNFLVTITIFVTDNRYMLYYICAMHTYWFFSVYFFMVTFQSWNEKPWRMAIKFVCYFIANLIIFDTPARDVVFKPLWFLLSYQNSMHEWAFRAGLDHYAALVGMLCAYHYPNYERFMNYLDKRHLSRQDYLMSLAIKLFVSGLFLIAVLIWFRHLMWRDKYDYNVYHPYTSWVPILAYIYFRNLFPVLRTHYMDLFAWLGKITLETYISQLHIYMQDGAKSLIVYIPGYPLLNFALATVIYILASYWLFHITVEFSAFLIPKDLKKVGVNIVVGTVVIGLCACAAILLRETKLF